MTTPAKPSGLKPPSKLAKPQTGIPRPSSLQPAVKVEETVAKSARRAGLSPTDAANHAEKNVKVVPQTAPAANGSKDNFKVGDRVIVSGTKHGRIQFIGETQFATGDWAGVVLDEPIGKNDGSVNGVRYFQCEAKRGVFARPDKLVLESTATNGTKKPSGSGLMRPAGLPSAPRMGTKVASPRGPVSKDGKTPIGTSALAQDDSDNTGLKVGDRVLVSGTKLGILRFVGATEFAKGEWAGVELDDEMGKNDGAVAGTRYFQCRPKYGLFAPVHKVAKVHTQSSSLVESARSRRSNSSSSLSSMGSRNYGLNASSGSIMTSKSSELRKISTPQKSSIAKPSTTRRLSKLKRPEGKISRSSSQNSLLSDADSVDLNENIKENKEEAEHEIALLKLRHEKYVRDSEDNLETVKSLLESADREKVQILQQLEEERRKVEDYQFRLEEATINSSDMKAEYEGGSEKMKELEASLKVESDKAAKFLQDIDDLKNQIENKDFKIAELETEMSTFTEQMDVMKNELEESKEQIRRFESNQKDNDQTTQQLETKISRISELETLVEELEKTKAEQKMNLVSLEQKLKEETTSKEDLDSIVKDLREKLTAKEASLDSTSSSLSDIKSSLADLERRFQASESKCEQLTEDKRKLEGEIAELIKNSGNSSEQLSSMNEELRAKDRRIEELQQEISEASQKVSKLSDDLNQSQEDANDKISRLREKQDQETADHQKRTESLVHKPQA